MNQEQQYRTKKEKMDQVADKMSAYRRNLVILILIVDIICALGVSALAGCYWDEIISIGFVGLLLFLVMIFHLETNRIQAGPYDMVAKEYNSALEALLISAIVTIVCVLLPQELFPVMLFSIIGSAAYDSVFGIISGGTFLCFFHLAGCGDEATLVTGILFLFSGGVIVKMYGQEKQRTCTVVSTVGITAAVSILVRFLVYKEVTPVTVLYAIVCGGITAVISAVFVPRFLRRRKNIEKDTYVRFLDENYQLLRMMKNFSTVDYEHAWKVSDLCGKCAELCNADVNAARMGGLYYRVGRMQGEPFVENGKKLAHDFEFPHEVYLILSEYNGEEHLPSTIESAIVHMVDCVLTKTELLDDKIFSTEWNREMLVYQTLNEKSSAGLYDNSGLSMNLFLKLREYLAKEGF